MYNKNVLLLYSKTRKFEKSSIARIVIFFKHGKNRFCSMITNQDNSKQGNFPYFLPVFLGD